jgi:flagella basal body P-ring formation protein FlgA
MNRNFRKVRVFTTAIVATLCAAVANAAIDIQLRERVVASSPVIRLGDVAEVVSADRAQARQLAALPLMPAPTAGTERFLRDREVLDLLAAHGHNTTEIRLDGAAQVAITAAGTKAGNIQVGNRQAALAAGRIERPDTTATTEEGESTPSDKLRTIIESYLTAKSDQPAVWRVSCEVAKRHAAPLETAITPLVCSGGREPWTGRQRFVVSFETAQGRVHVPVYANVQNLTSSVVVAVRTLAKGDVITAADVELQNIESPAGATARRATIGAVDNVIGMEARQSIQEGQVIFTDQVQPPLMVKRGDLVTVNSQGGGIRVRTTARARVDGVRGELIQVESLESRERYDVQVIGPNEAAVFATTRPTTVEPTADKVETARR